MSWQYGREKLEYLKKIDDTYPKTVYGIVSVSWAGVGALPYFGFSEPFKDIRNFIILILTILIFIIITCFIIYYTKENRNDIDATIVNARKLLAEGKNANILILRVTDKWSRSLWVEGKPYARLELGKIAKQAAINLGDDKTLASIYIDDLGWTLVSLKQLKEAEEYLREGLKIAEKEKDYYLIAKANRHLAGMALAIQNYDEADKLIKEAESAAARLPDGTERNEMLAGIYYALSTRFLEESKVNKTDNILTKAMNYALQSEDLRRSGEKTRLVRTYALKGAIFEARNDRLEAEKQYRYGLKLSKELGRTDEIIRNHLGLARIAKLDNNMDDYKMHTRQAMKLLKKTPCPFKIDEKEMKLIQEGV